MRGQRVEQKPATWGEALGGLIAIGLLFMVGSCVFGGSDEETARTSTAATQTSSALTVRTNSPSQGASAKPVTSIDEPAEITNARATVKEQFFPDQVDRSGSAKYQKEWWMIKGIVRQSGYPCAAVAFVQQQFDGTFKALCKVTLYQNKYDAFVINPSTQSVEPL